MQYYSANIPKVGYQSSSKGFTLIELIVAVLVLAIVTTIGIPAFNDLIDQYRLSTIKDDINASHNFARSSAISLGTSVSLCGASNSELSAEGECSLDWSNGWIAYQIKGGVLIPIRYWSPNGQITITADSISTFLPDGSLKLGNNHVEITQDDQTQCLTVLFSGQLVVTQGNCS
jgi:prepilin-type N-terminal cleavage/methylation domain-containing protein